MAQSAHVRSRGKTDGHAWLRANERAHLPWLAVDDRAWLFKPFNLNVYLVDGRTGLSDEDVEALVAQMVTPL